MSASTNNNDLVWLFSKGLIGTWKKHERLTRTLIPQFLWDFFYSVLQIKQRKPIYTSIVIKRVYICFLSRLREYRGLFFYKEKKCLMTIKRSCFLTETDL